MFYWWLRPPAAIHQSQLGTPSLGCGQGRRDPSFTSLLGFCFVTEILISTTEARTTWGFIIRVTRCTTHWQRDTESLRVQLPQLAAVYPSVSMTGTYSGCHPGLLQNIWPAVYLPSFVTVGSCPSLAPFTLPQEVQPSIRCFLLRWCGNQFERNLHGCPNLPPARCRSPTIPPCEDTCVSVMALLESSSPLSFL